MRVLMNLGLAALLAGVAMPALAADAPAVDKRVTTLESQMKAVQRKVFPGGDKKFFEPEFQPTEQPAPAAPIGTPATSPIADLTTRVDSLERQLQTLTGQVEQATYKSRQTEEALAKFRADTEFRLNALEGTGKAPAGPDASAAPAAAEPIATPKPAAKPGVKTPPKPVSVGDSGGTTDAPMGSIKPAAKSDEAVATPAPSPTRPSTPDEAAYQAAYAFVAAKQYDQAETALTAFVAKYPKSPKASQAQYWLGRAYMAQHLPAQAAKAYLDNYRNMPKGARAPDSLLGLGGALMAMDPPNPDKACEVYGELQTAYGAKLTADQTAQLKRARTTAKCAS